MKLTISEPSRFYAYKDEKMFFAWLESIPAVKRIEGAPNGLDVHLKQPIDDESVRELTALLMRYRLDMRCLRKLASTPDKKWYREKKNYWHRKVFGTQSRKLKAR